MFENENKQVELSDQMWTSREKIIRRNLPESSLARILGETGKDAFVKVNGNNQQLIEEAKNAEFEDNLRKVSHRNFLLFFNFIQC